VHQVEARRERAVCEPRDEVTPCLCWCGVLHIDAPRRSGSAKVADAAEEADGDVRVHERHGVLVRRPPPRMLSRGASERHKASPAIIERSG
jgi:hypothetical protein